MILALTTAMAGYYHPSDVAAASQAFARASEATSDRAKTAQREARGLATALNDWEEALDALGSRAPATERRTHADASRTYARQLAVLQADVDALVGGFDAAFGAALQRALAAHPGAERCEATVPVGRSLPGMPTRREPNPACTGDDLNARLAAALDRDAKLQADLAALSTTWTGLDLGLDPLAVDGTRWISVPTFLRVAARQPLAAIRRADEEARLPIEAQIEQGADPEALAALRPQADAITAATAERRATLLAPVFARAEVVFDKRAPDAVWCPRPTVLGGCVGTDDTAALTTLLRGDRKLVRALP